MRSQTTSSIGNSSLLFLVIFTVFVVPVFPQGWHRLMFSLLYTGIFVMASLALTRHRKKILWLAGLAILTEWIAGALGMQILTAISEGVNIIFFLIVVIGLILQVAKKTEVTVQVIMEAINGYLLLGMVFSILVGFIMLYEPAAYNFPPVDPELGDVSHFSNYLYFGFVTFTTVGYGDVLPQLPYTKSLAIFTGVAGQIYVAVIIAMLVGKFSSNSKGE